MPWFQASAEVAEAICVCVCMFLVASKFGVTEIKKKNIFWTSVLCGLPARSSEHPHLKVTKSLKFQKSNTPLGCYVPLMPLHIIMLTKSKQPRIQ